MARGHDEYAVVHRYSLEKLEAYVDAAQETQRGDLMDLAVAFHNPKQLVKEIQKAQRNKGKPTDVSSRAELNKLRSLASKRK